MWDAVIAVHLKGTFLCSQAFVKQAIAQGSGGAHRQHDERERHDGQLRPVELRRRKGRHLRPHAHDVDRAAEAPDHGERARADREDAPDRGPADVPGRRDDDARSTSRRPRSSSRATSAAIARVTCSRSRARASTRSRSSRRPASSRTTRRACGRRRRSPRTGTRSSRRELALADLGSVWPRQYVSGTFTPPATGT